MAEAAAVVVKKASNRQIPAYTVGGSWLVVAVVVSLLLKYALKISIHKGGPRT